VRGDAHFVASLAMVGPLAYLALPGEPTSAALLAVAVAACATLPDVDAPGSPASKALGYLLGRRTARAFSRGMWDAGLHRSGWTHSVVACLVWPLLLLALPAYALGVRGEPLVLLYAVPAGGCLLHVLQDWWPWGSVSGVPLLAWLPLPSRLRRRRWKCRLGPRRPRSAWVRPPRRGAPRGPGATRSRGRAGSGAGWGHR